MRNVPDGTDTVCNSDARAGLLQRQAAAGIVLPLEIAGILGGLAILLWKPIVAMTRGMIKLIKAVFRGIKSVFVK